MGDRLCLQAQTTPQWQFQPVGGVFGGVKQLLNGQAKDFTDMHRRLIRRGQARHHLTRDRVGASDPAV